MLFYLTMNLDNEIWAYSLKNALEHGKADVSRILPKLFQHGLEKKDIKKVMSNVREIISKVNSLKKEELEKELEKYDKYVKEKDVRQEGELPELEGAVQGKVVTRITPEPSKYSHIGHALVFLIQYFYAKKYNGKCILRFDDTNPEKSTLEFYNSIKEDLSWLGIKWDKEIIASDNMKEMYECAEKLIKKDDAFVCSCTHEVMKDLREKMKACPCRKNKKELNIKEWKSMLDGNFKEGERTLRLKGDMKSDNGVMRDPVLFRISFYPHFIQKNKYCVWPMYDFESPVEDSLQGVTHVIRSKEFELRAELHEKILSLLKLKMPIVREIGRYQITGAETQGRVIRELIEKKEITGWDDPRLVTVRAMKRRGFVPEMFQQMSKTVGMSKSGGHINPTVMESINRSLIDSIARRYSFVQNPIEIKIKNPPSIEQAEIPIHPSSKERREVEISDKFFISKSDFDEFKGKEIRLLHLYNIKLNKSKPEAEFTSTENRDIAKINWVSEGQEISILMPDGKWMDGLAEEAIDKVKENEVVQFERFGFARCDRKARGKDEFWFTHK